MGQANSIIGCNYLSANIQIYNNSSNNNKKSALESQGASLYRLGCSPGPSAVFLTRLLISLSLSALNFLQLPQEGVNNAQEENEIKHGRLTP